MEQHSTPPVERIGLNRLPKLDEDLLALLRRATRLSKKSVARLRRLVEAYLADGLD